MESKKYIVVKNHVREISKDVENNIDESNESDEKTKKKSKKPKKQQQSSSDDNVDTNEISKSDLKELKSVYNKCKDVLLRIESKYGNLLDLDSEYGPAIKRKWEPDSNQKCDCILNKRIIFNDDGQQKFEENNAENHICPKKLRSDKKYFPEKYQNIQIEEEDSLNNLPESIQELSDLLKNPSIKSSLRYAVIEKIKSIRQDYLNMIRFDRSMLIQTLKESPDEVMDFKGTNISSLLGYPTQ